MPREMRGRDQELLAKEREQKFVSTTYIDLTRHGNRFGGPIKVTLDKLEGALVDVDDKQELTPRGRERSKQFGAAAYEDVTLVHPRGGDELRHGQTGEDILEGSGKFGEARTTPSPILYEKEVPGKDGNPVKAIKLKGARQGKGVDYGSSGIADALKSGKKLINDTLQGLVNNLSKEEQERFQTDPEYRAQLREQAQVTGLKFVMGGQENVVQRLAENEAYELMHDVELSRRGVKSAKPKAITLVGSGLFAESLFKKALVVEDTTTGEKKTGFTSADEIGGFTKQATAFRIKLVRDNSKGDPRNLEDFDKDTTIACEFVNDPERAEFLKGKKLSLDWKIVRQLAKAAEERFVAKGSV